MSRFRRASRATVLALAACSPAGGGPRDVVPDTHAVTTTTRERGAASDDYLFVARRDHSMLGIVATKGMTTDDAARIGEHLADELETCARIVDASGKLAVGAAKLTAGTSLRGATEVGEVRLAPGGDVAANALQCLVGPIRTTPFPKDSSLLLDATWNPVRSRNADSPLADAGAPR